MTRQNGSQDFRTDLRSNGVARLKPGSVQLLTADQEFELVSQLGQLRSKLERLIRPVIEKAPEDRKLDHFDQIIAFFEEVVDLGSQLYRQAAGPLREYKEIKHRLVLANVPWVTKLARSQRNSNISEDDLFQEGVCGLLKAIDRFEPERGLRLMTYATWYIREAMQQIRARQSHLVSISSHDQTLLGQLESKQSQFQHKHGRLPNTKELGEGTRGTAKSIVRLQMATRPAVSLDRGAGDGAIPIPIGDPSLEVDRRDELQVAITRLLDVLPERERMIVSRRFGLEGNEPTSLETLGDDLRVSKERIRQLQRQAIRRMQKLAADEQLAGLGSI